MRRLCVVGSLLCFLSRVAALRIFLVRLAAVQLLGMRHKPGACWSDSLNDEHEAFVNIWAESDLASPDVIWTVCVSSEFAPVCSDYIPLRSFSPPFLPRVLFLLLSRAKRCHLSRYCQVVLMHVSVLSPLCPFLVADSLNVMNSFPGDAFHRVVLPKKHPAYFSSKHNRSVGINDTWDLSLSVHP